MGSAPVVLLTRQGCHLCEEAAPLVQGECDARSIDVEVLDVDADPALREQFTNHVPVLLVRGVLVDYWRVDAERLRRALDGQPVDPPAPL
ncbi:glutaredoxin family protein [Luteococcus sp. OSA5]|uniref:glutaredoxin family protein n=1 Tax=Luteococcus sp. OSA5 TaxID=3401630 RepID=UPI003B432740